MANDIPVVYIGSNTDASKGSFTWWKLDKNSIHQGTFSVVNYIQSQQQYRNVQNLKHARLYQNMEFFGLTPGSMNQSFSPAAGIANTVGSQNRLTLNIIKSCVDTAASKIGKNKPRPLFLTEDGDYSLKRKAKYLTKYLEGLFEETKIYTAGQRVFIDACVFGTGCLKIFSESDQVRCERVLIDEIICDDVEGIYGKPRQIHQRKNVSREVLRDLFPEFKDQINAASSHLQNESNISKSVADQVVLIESWHLPSGPNAQDGRHTITVDTVTLLEEEYKKDYFPFVFLRWSDRLMGFFGQGLAEELIGIQLEINKVLKTIQASLHLMAVPRVFVDVASNINSSLINNAIGGIIKYSGQPPVFQSPQAVNPEVYAYLESLIKKGYEITGISQMNAASRKEPGITSGVAIRETNDIASERFVLTGMRFEEFYMEAAKIMIDQSRDLYAENKKLMVKAADNKFINKIKWSDVDMKDDQFTMRMFPVSLLPSTPAGKLQTVQDLVEAGFVGKDQAMELLDFPDVEKFFSLKTAAVDNIERAIEAMLEHGEYNPPEPFQNLQLALTMTQESYLRARSDKVPEDRLELMRTFMEDIQNLLQPPAPAPDMSQPPGAPMNASNLPPPLSSPEPTMAPTSPLPSLQ